MRYKFLEHTADIKFMAYGKTPEKVFKNSAIAVRKSIYPGLVRRKIKKEINASGKDIESLMYNFLEEFLVLFDSENFLASKIKNILITKKNNGKFELNCIVLGDNSGKYKIRMHIKAVTYNEMFVKKQKNGRWISQVVLDI